MPISMGARRGTIAIIVATIALGVLLVLPAAALANPTFANQTPVANSNLATATPYIKVDATDTIPLTTQGFQMRIDGVLVRSTFTYKTSDKKQATISYQSLVLTPGPHTVSVKVNNAFMYGSTTTWSFRVPPKVTSPSPASGTTVQTLAPPISATVVDRGLSTGAMTIAMSIDGQIIPTADITYDPATKVITYASHLLQNEASHTVTIAVTNEFGATSAPLTWTFRVELWNSMPGEYANCADCHAGYPLPNHPMTNCYGCHGESAPMNETTPHSADWLIGGGPYQLVLTCTDCHNLDSSPRVPMHLETPGTYHAAQGDMSGCSCHSTNLLNQHSGWTRPDGSAVNLTCAACHQSADADVKVAVGSGDTRCVACHDMATHPDPGGNTHLAGVAADALPGVTPPVTCSGCHLTVLPQEHGRTTASSAGAACGNCHPSPRNTLSPWLKGCVQAGCHATGTSSQQHSNQATAHQVPSQRLQCTTASDCHHHQGDLPTLHEQASVVIDSQTRTSCLVCHSTTSLPSNDCANAACHPSKVDGDGNVVNHGFDPLKHSATDSNFSGTVAQPSDYSPYTPAYAFSPACSGCHDLQIQAEHAKPTASSAAAACGNCHPAPRDTLTPWTKTCVQSGCHQPSTSAQMHTDIPATAHAIRSADRQPDPGCAYAPGGAYGCHYADLVTEHNRLIVTGAGSPAPTGPWASVSCVQCHTSTKFQNLSGPWNGSCTACHTGNHSVAGSAANSTMWTKHNASGDNFQDAHGYDHFNSHGQLVGCNQSGCHERAYWPPNYPDIFFGPLTDCYVCH